MALLLRKQEAREGADLLRSFADADGDISATTEVGSNNAWVNECGVMWRFGMAWEEQRERVQAVLGLVGELHGFGFRFLKRSACLGCISAHR
jgi:hypothetical protein